MELKIDALKSFSQPGDAVTFEHDGFQVFAKVVADEDVLVDETREGPFTGVVVEVALVVTWTQPGFTKDQVVVLGESSLWGIDGLDDAYGLEIVGDQLPEALGQARDALQQLKAVNL